MRPAAAVALLVGIALACREPATMSPVHLDHDAYVWQRAWTGAVHAAVAGAPPELTGLRVLAVELGGGDAAPAWPSVDAAALAEAARAVTAVVRIDGSRPVAELPAAALRARLDAWRAAGVDVVGVEIDHDCATAALPAYARWLAAARPPAPLRFSMTALPTWAGAPGLADVAAAVDELVVQVHAVRAPRVFEPRAARADLDRFARAVRDRPLRVALPTYEVEVAGARRRAEPREVAAFLRELERAPVPGVRGVVWFRLPVGGDHAAWAGPTLRAVITGAPLDAAVAARLVPRGDGRFDVVVRNDGAIDAPWPRVRLGGEVAAADLVGGYRRHGRRWLPPPRTIRPGDELVVGWAVGEELTIDAR